MLRPRTEPECGRGRARDDPILGTIAHGVKTRRDEPVQSFDPCTTRTTVLPSRVLGGLSLLMVLALLAAACHERQAALGTYRSEGRAAMASPAPVTSRVVRVREREEPVRAGGAGKHC